jgi:hypothetical protein
MVNPFRALDLRLIEQGQFLKDADVLLRELQDKLYTYCRLHGDKATKNAKGKLTLEVALVCEKSQNPDFLFTIRATSKISLPGAPPSVSMAIAGEDQDERGALFVRASGSTEDHPSQGVLHTKDGRKVNPDTGEALD